MTSKKTKIIGEIILVLSFVTQTLIFDYYNDKSKLITDTSLAQAIVDKGSELKEIKYFVAKEPLDSLSEKQYQELNIGMAAQKIALGKAIQISVLDTNEQSKTYMSKQLIQASYRVRTFNDYMNFIQLVNDKFVGYEKITRETKRIDTLKDTFRWIFSTLYLIGSIFLIVAIIKE